MLGKERSFRLLKRAVQESHGDQTEAILLTEDSSLTRFARSGIHQHVAERNATLILRVVSEKRIAVVSTNDLSQSSIRRSLEKALNLARAQRPKEDFVSLPGPQLIPEVETFSPTLSRLTPERKAKQLEDLFRLAKEKGLHFSGAFSEGKVEVAIVNSLGIEAYQRYSDLFLHLIAQNGKNSGYGSFVSRRPSELDLEGLAREAIGKVSSHEPIEIDPGEYEVILEPYAVSELLSFLGYLGFHALAVQEGRSFLCDQIGKKMVSEKVTIFDDGLDSEGLQVVFDFEGVPKKKVVFFDQGVAREVTYDSLTAKREGKESTGHALIAPNPEGPVPINLFMKEGTSSVDEMVRSVKRGIYVTRFHYTNVVEPMKAVITGMTRDGTFLIENGEIGPPIKNLRFTQSILEALLRVKAISRERKRCSEGTVYSRRFVTATVAPTLHVEGFRFTGVSSLEEG